MKLFTQFLLLTTVLISASLFASSSATAESFYDFKFVDTNKKEIKFNEFNGKTVMIVNIATRCGYTGQLDDLEKLYQTYKAKDFIIIGFPSNDFNEQAPESNKEITDICRLKYGVTFPIFEKQVVLGDKKNPLFKWLTSQKGHEGEIAWNFTKFLVNKEGKIVNRFQSNIEPLDKSLMSTIEKNL